jgi:hypothetical protein
VRGHADAETLAAFREDLLSRRKAGRVSAHLAACSRCTALDAQLAGVTTLLASTTAPPIPDALTARIEAALAAEAAARPAAPAGAAVPAAGPAARPGAAPGAAGHDGASRPAGRGPSRPGRGRAWLTLRVAAVTAAVAVIAGGGYGVAQLLSGGSAANTGAASSAAGAPAPKGRLNAPSMPTAGGLGGAAGGTAHAPSNATTIAPHVVYSGTNYQPGRLGAQASAVLARFRLRTPASPSPTLYQPAEQRQLSTLFPALEPCVTNVAGTQHPLLVDLARYRSHPAAIIMLPATAGRAARALVIAPGCTSTTAHVLAQAPLPPSTQP